MASDCQDSLRVHPCKLGRDVLSLTVLAITNHPGSGHAGDFPNG